MKKMMNWVLAAILCICGASVFTAYTNDDNETVDTEVSVTPSQSRVGYSAWNTQVSYTHCDPLPKAGFLHSLFQILLLRHTYFHKTRHIRIGQ